MTDPGLMPKKGAPVLPWWRRVLEWAMTLPVIIGPNVVATQTPLGLKVRIRSQNPVRTPFRVGLQNAGEEVSVSVGTVDGEVPWITMDRSDVGNVRLDGTRQGTLDPVSSTLVRYHLDDDEPGDDGRSFVCVVAHLDRMRALGLTSPGQHPTTLRIEHFPDLSAETRAAARAESGAVIHPLAVLYWTADRSRPERVGQVCHHNLQLFVDAEGVGYFAAT